MWKGKFFFWISANNPLPFPVTAQINHFLLHINFTDFIACVHLSQNLFSFGISFILVLNGEYCVTLHFAPYFQFGHLDFPKCTKFLLHHLSPPALLRYTWQSLYMFEMYILIFWCKYSLWNDHHNQTHWHIHHFIWLQFSFFCHLSKFLIYNTVF